MTLPPFTFPQHPSPQVKVVREYLEYLAVYDTDRLSTLMTDDFVQSTSPINLGEPDKTKTVDLAFIKDLQALLQGQTLKFTIYNVNDGPGQTWVHANIETLGIEVIYLFQFRKEIYAHKVTSLREFTDSKAYTALNPTSPDST